MRKSSTCQSIKITISVARLCLSLVLILFHLTQHDGLSSTMRKIKENFNENLCDRLSRMKIDFFMSAFHPHTPTHTARRRKFIVFNILFVDLAPSHPD